MQILRRRLKRITIDASGYALIFLGIALGWLPGPGGIPLIVAGLGLLSIHNEWAERLRNYVLENGGRFVKWFFPANPYIQWLYDALVLLLIILVTLLVINRSAAWQIGLATAGFFIAVFIALMNRDRLDRLKHKLKS